MTPATQEFVDGERGDCLRACLASILDLPISEVPNFMDYQGAKWFDAFLEFLLSRGYEYAGWYPPEKVVELSPGVDGYFIGTVESLNFPGRTHAVIFKGKDFVHDPSPWPSKPWTLSNVRGFYVIERKTT